MAHQLGARHARARRTVRSRRADGRGRADPIRRTRRWHSGTAPSPCGRATPGLGEKWRTPSAIGDRPADRVTRIAPTPLEHASSTVTRAMLGQRWRFWWVSRCVRVRPCDRSASTCAANSRRTSSGSTRPSAQRVRNGRQLGGSSPRWSTSDGTSRAVSTGPWWPTNARWAPTPSPESRNEAAACASAGTVGEGRRAGDDPARAGTQDGLAESRRQAVVVGVHDEERPGHAGAEPIRPVPAELGSRPPNAGANGCRSPAHPGCGSSGPAHATRRGSPGSCPTTTASRRRVSGRSSRGRPARC